jgi:hypothetical protein
MTTVRFMKTGREFRCSFSYDPRLVELCKSVPSWARSYEPATKTWTFDPQFAHMLAADFQSLGHTVIGLEDTQERARRAPPPPPPPALPPADSWAVLLLARAAEADLETSVYRALSKVLHTDVGGDATMMTELNAAFRNGNRAAS